jgi:F0F1-type ATP synthase membrane subunit b/b'
VENLVAALVFLLVAVLIFGLAIRFAMVFLVPRIQGAIDRAIPTDEEPRDRPR